MRAPFGCSVGTVAFLALPLLAPLAAASESKPSESLELAVEIVAGSLQESGEAFAPLHEMLFTEPELELELVLATIAGSLDDMGVVLDSASDSLAVLPPYEGDDFALAAEAMRAAGKSAHLAAGALADGDLDAAATAFDALAGTLSSLLESAGQNASPPLENAINKTLRALADVRAMATQLAAAADGGGVTQAFEGLLATLSLPSDQLDAFSQNVLAAVGGPLESSLYLDQPHYLDVLVHAAALAADPSVVAWVAEASVDVPGWLERHTSIVLAVRLGDFGGACTSAGSLLTSGFGYGTAGGCVDQCGNNLFCGPCQLGEIVIGTGGCSPAVLEAMQAFLSRLMSLSDVPGVNIPSLGPGIQGGLQTGIGVLIDYQRMVSPSVYAQACWRVCEDHMCKLVLRQRRCEDANKLLEVSPPSGSWSPTVGWTPSYWTDTIQPACDACVKKFCSAPH